MRNEIMISQISCPVCTLNNPSANVQCEACGNVLKMREKIVHDLSYSPEIGRPESHLPRIQEVNEQNGSSFVAADDEAVVFNCITDSIACRSCTYANPVTTDNCHVCAEPLRSKRICSSPSQRYSPLDYTCTSNITNEGRLITNASSMSNSESLTDGVMNLLHHTLRQELSSSPAITTHCPPNRKGGNSLCNYRLSCVSTPHITQKGVTLGGDWSCGYRNIQMMCHALMALPSYRARLFGGAGDVPDVHGLQAWIEKAWRAGFDTEGCFQLGGVLLGTTTWIGATECAALLRYMGVRARLVDFSACSAPSPIPKGNSSSLSSSPSSSAIPITASANQSLISTVAYLPGDRHGEVMDVDTDGKGSDDKCSSYPPHRNGNNGEDPSGELLCSYSDDSDFEEGAWRSGRGSEPFARVDMMRKGRLEACNGDNTSLGDNGKTGTTSGSKSISLAADAAVAPLSATARAPSVSPTAAVTAHYAENRPKRRKKRPLTYQGSVKTTQRNTHGNEESKLHSWVQEYYETSQSTRQLSMWVHRGEDMPGSCVCGECVDNASCEYGVRRSERCVFVPPLYFQHDGHSRTLVGYEQRSGSKRSSLFVFDPNILGRKLLANLREGKAWQPMLKRGVHTLHNSQYQIVCIDPGLMQEGSDEYESAKILTSDAHRLWTKQTSR